MKTWCKPEIKSIQEKELLEKLAVKAQSGGSHNDSHSDHTN